MANDKAWASLSMMVVSLGLLAIDLGIFTAGKSAISLGVISVGDIEIRRPDVLVAITVSIVFLLLIMHVSVYIEPCIIWYKKGYQDNKNLCSALRSFLIAHVGHDKVGCPTGNLIPGWKKKPIFIAECVKANGELSPKLDYDIPEEIHYECRLSGICNAILSRSFFVLACGSAIAMFASYRAIT